MRDPEGPSIPFFAPVSSHFRISARGDGDGSGPNRTSARTRAAHAEKPVTVPSDTISYTSNPVSVPRPGAAPSRSVFRTVTE
jgi:hypothetical protein